MQERERQRTRTVPPGAVPGSDFFDAASAPAGDPVLVSHGTFAETLPVGGMTVEQVRTRFRDRLDIHPGAVAVLGGRPVDDGTVVRAGQVLSFVRPSGEKGRS